MHDEGAPEVRKETGCVGEILDLHAQDDALFARDELPVAGGDTPSRVIERRLEEDLDVPSPRDAGEGGGDEVGRVQIGGRGSRGSADADVAHPVEAQGSELVSLFVEGDAVPPSAMKDDAVGTKRPLPGSAVMPLVLRRDRPAPLGRLGNREQRIGGCGRGLGSRRGGEPQALLEGPHSLVQTQREHPPELGERVRGCGSGHRSADSLGDVKRNDDGDGLIDAQHEWRHPVARREVITPSRTAGRPDRYVERLQGGDVPPDCPRVDLESGGRLRPGDEGALLKELQQL